MDDPPFLPFALPSIGTDELSAAVEALQSGWLTQGARVIAFEGAFSERLGAANAVALSSGTAALHLSLVILGVAKGDEVITSPFTFASTANVIELVGATPVFADINEVTLNIDPRKVEEKITPRTRAILPVHFAGLPCEMEELRAVADCNNLPLIEDATHALGAVRKGKQVGSESHFAAFSFYPIKNMTAIEGGMLVTSDEVAAKRAKLLRWYGLSEAVWQRVQQNCIRYPEVIEPGWKYNMNDVQASVGLVQLARLNEFIERRYYLSRRYLDLLDGVGKMRLPMIETQCSRSACHLFVIRTEPNDGINRDLLALELQRRRIGTSLHYRSLHLHPYYRKRYGLNAVDLPIAARASEQVLSLPLYPAMTDDDVDRVASAVRDVFRER